MVDPAIERREGALTANRIRELAERPLQGRCDADHLSAVHTYIFQDPRHHRPGGRRADVPGWSKFRSLEGLTSVHEVHYVHDNVAGEVGRVLQDLGGPSALSTLAPDAFASRMARLYGDLDHIYSSRKRNSRTLREF
jgi:cell filamentation protein